MRRLGLAAALLSACTAILDVPEAELAHVKCEDGACVCEAHFTHCTASASDRCETDLRSDPHHCGACGHDCLGGACEGGTCQPVIVAGIAGARSLVVHRGEVYVGVCPADSGVDGGPPPPAFVQVDFDSGSVVPALAAVNCGELPRVVGETLYWSGVREFGKGDVVSTPLPIVSPTQPVTVVIPDTIAVGMGMTDANVYWRELAYLGNDTWKDTGLWMTPRAGGQRALVAAQSVSMATWGDTVYWTTNDTSSTPPMVGVFQRDESGSSGPISAAPGRNVATGGGRLFYWVEEGTAETPNGIYALPLPILDPHTPPAPTLVVPDVPSMGALLADAKAIYWIEYVAGVLKMKELDSDAPPRVLAKGGFSGIARLHADEKAVYYLAGADAGRVAK